MGVQVSVSFVLVVNVVEDLFDLIHRSFENKVASRPAPFIIESDIVLKNPLETVANLEAPFIMLSVIFLTSP